MMTDQESENRFFKMLALCPELVKFWDQKEAMPKMKSITSHIARTEYKDSAMLSFFVAVWFGSNDIAEFDFIEAMKVISERERKIIRKWMAAPFFCGDWA